MTQAFQSASDSVHCVSHYYSNFVFGITWRDDVSIRPNASAGLVTSKSNALLVTLTEK